MILVLQTNIDNTSAIWFVVRDKILARALQTVAYPQRSQPLRLLDQLLQKKKKKASSIQRIIVSRGPGRFSAVRTGLLIANTIGQEQKIPVSGIVRKTLLTDDQVLALSQQKAAAKFTAVRPWYGKQPNITKPKKR